MVKIFISKLLRMKNPRILKVNTMPKALLLQLRTDVPLHTTTDCAFYPNPTKCLRTKRIFCVQELDFVFFRGYSCMTYKSK